MQRSTNHRPDAMALPKLSSRRIFGMIIFFHLQLIISSLSLSLSRHEIQQNINCCRRRKRSRDATTLKQTRKPISTIQTEESCLSAAPLRLQLLFGNSKTESTTASHCHGKRIATVDKSQKISLVRLNGIDLYGLEIVHASSDAETATMSIPHATQDSSSLDRTTLWDATLILQPDSTRAIGDDAVGLIPQQHTSCFVAMNRFQVKEDCKALFEERWAQRQSKLSYQPGFLSFSLLRKRNVGGDEDYDRFNYSTCTIWDRIESWKQWRNGEGKSSHDASRQAANVQKRVPVSEWLEGPSSPIFWDATQ